MGIEYSFSINNKRIKDLFTIFKLDLNFLIHETLVHKCFQQRNQSHYIEKTGYHICLNYATNFLLTYF